MREEDPTAAFKSPEEMKKGGPSMTNKLSAGVSSIKTKISPSKPPKGKSGSEIKSKDKVNEKSKGKTKDEGISTKLKSDAEWPPSEIQLPDDDPSDWEALLFWMMDPDRNLPEDTISNDVKLVRLWNLGFRHNFKGFADAAMLELMRLFEKREEHPDQQSVSDEAIQRAFCSDIKGPSKVRAVVTQEMMKSNFVPQCNFTLHPINSDKHLDLQCEDCQYDNAKLQNLFKCDMSNSPRNKSSDHECGLGERLWKFVLAVKIRWYTKRGEKDACYKRLQGDQWLEFLVSEKWVSVDAWLDNYVKDLRASWKPEHD